MSPTVALTLLAQARGSLPPPSPKAGSAFRSPPQRSCAHTPAAQRFPGTGSPPRAARRKGPPCKQTWGPVVLAHGIWEGGTPRPSCRGLCPPAAEMPFTGRDVCVMEARAGQALLEPRGTSEGMARWAEDKMSPWAREPHPGLGRAPAPTPTCGLKGALGRKRTGEDRSQMPCPRNSYFTFAKLFMVAICCCCPVLVSQCHVLPAGCRRHQDRGWRCGPAPTPAVNQSVLLLPAAHPCAWPPVCHFQAAGDVLSGEEGSGRVGHA